VRKPAAERRLVSIESSNKQEPSVIEPTPHVPRVRFGAVHLDPGNEAGEVLWQKVLITCKTARRKVCFS
jgi:hypothetical protein